MTQMPQHLINKGKGAFPLKGSKVEVHYSGTLLNGKKFDSSRDRRTPFAFYVGRRQVITCWDEVVSNLTVGDKVNIICPSQTAYGSSSVAGIPANSPLRFQIEVLRHL